MKCRIEHCLNEANVPGSARDLCRAHYRRWQRWGDETIEPKRLYKWDSSEKCTENGCDKKVKTVGLCVNHYALKRRRNDPEGNKRRSLAFKERLIKKRETILGRPRPILCELCNETGYERGNKPNTGIVFDHDHKSGKARGWICDRCNKVLGLVKDSAILLRVLADYLEKHNEVDSRAA